MFSAIEKPSSFTLLLAPPAWGKTRLLFSIFALQRRPIIFLAPLKAVAWQFYQSACQESFTAYFPQSRQEVKTLWPKFCQQAAAFWVITLERLEDFMLQQAGWPSASFGRRPLPLIVLDEFHLYYQWGGDFRPIMWEKAMLCGISGWPILGLSGTMSDSFLQRWQADFGQVCSAMTALNLGNFALKFWPEEVVIFPARSAAAFKRRWLAEVMAAHKRARPFTFLYFCAYRAEVDDWLDFCQRHHIKALGCVSGKVDQFMAALAQGRPECIFATIALGHGVTLPPLEQVYLGLPISSAASWWQMAGRGGRRGERFKIFALGRPPAEVLASPAAEAQRLWGGKTRVKRFLQAWAYDCWLRCKLWWYPRP